MDWVASNSSRREMKLRDATRSIQEENNSEGTGLAVIGNRAGAQKELIAKRRACCAGRQSRPTILKRGHL
jgi:hypothetical protein